MMAVPRKQMKLIDGVPHWPCAGKCTPSGYVAENEFPKAQYGICPVKPRCFACKRAYQRDRDRGVHSGVRGKAGPASPIARQQAADGERIAKLVAERRQMVDVLPILAAAPGVQEHLRWRAS